MEMEAATSCRNADAKLGLSAVMAIWLLLSSVSAMGDVYKCESEAGVVFSERRCGEQYEIIDVPTEQKKRGARTPDKSLAEKDHDDYLAKLAEIEREIEFIDGLLPRIRRANREENRDVILQLEARKSELSISRSALNQTYSIIAEYHLKKALDAQYEVEEERKRFERDVRRLREKLRY